MAAELNSDLMWSMVPHHVQSAFAGHHATRVRLPAMSEIFTVSHDRVTGRANDSAVPEFWSPVAPYRGDPGFQARLELAKAARGRTVDLMRDMSATDGEPKTSRYAIIIRLHQPVWAFFGPIQQQGKAGGLVAGNRPMASRNAASRGGLQVGYKYYIPGLTDPDYFHRVKAHDLIFG